MPKKERFGSRMGEYRQLKVGQAVLNISREPFYIYFDYTIVVRQSGSTFETMQHDKILDALFQHTTCWLAGSVKHAFHY
jgi:hypothetical protein